MTGCDGIAWKQIISGFISLAALDEKNLSIGYLHEKYLFLNVHERKACCPMLPQWETPLHWLPMMRNTIPQDAPNEKHLSICCPNQESLHRLLQMRHYDRDSLPLSDIVISLDHPDFHSYHQPCSSPASVVLSSHLSGDYITLTTFVRMYTSMTTKNRYQYWP